ncbi:hypothetical protein [Cellvibrio japonicus]|uniref:hypothetical protein n=1 Tax=Cellvibrio japonicus TaxID=155077 RepID=UPI0005A130B2|nr:hypothetical protein [Cellvibrio japonicus]QEI11807.1 hypothetical protein FY117_05880 [Cellvibrio japonicus]QEI15381.1 hypothetical protein FY116_05880 [Cellvibrio japonicus]QEI18960.1 hypothetical protein FY115_05880 [Cellvibrio japonicus]
MSYLVFCTFDLKNASSQDYKNVYSDLDKLGLKKIVKSGNGGDAVIPTTSVMGEFNGTSAESVRDHVRSQVKQAISNRGLKSEIFLIASGDWAWVGTTT